MPVRIGGVRLTLVDMNTPLADWKSSINSEVAPVPNAEPETVTLPPVIHVPEVPETDGAACAKALSSAAKRNAKARIALAVQIDGLRRDSESTLRCEHFLNDRRHHTVGCRLGSEVDGRATGRRADLEGVCRRAANEIDGAGR